MPRGALGWVHARAGNLDKARELLAELRARPKDAPSFTSDVWLLAALGETDAAFERLGQALDEGQPFVYYTASLASTRCALPKIEGSLGSAGFVALSDTWTWTTLPVAERIEGNRGRSDRRAALR